MQSNKEKSFLIFLIGQGISSLGDSIRFIAGTMIIFNLSGSGLSTALGIALSTLPNIIASPFAGVIGDRRNERAVLALTDIARFLIVPLLLNINNLLQVYALLIVLSSFDVFYGPSKRKFTLRLTGKDGALKANSQLIGVAGAAYLSGPLAAGFLTDIYGPAPAIIIASLCSLISCVLTISASIVYDKGRSRKERLAARKDNCFSHPIRRKMTQEFCDGLQYCFSVPAIKSLIILGFITGFCTISVNLAFYPYAFDVLKVTAKGWSLMISIYYGTSLGAMLLVNAAEGFITGQTLRKSGQKRERLGDRRTNITGMGGGIFYISLVPVAVIWVLYSVAKKIAIVLLLQFIEGSMMAVCGILIAAGLQISTDNKFMARVSGLNDIFSSAGKLLGMAFTALLSRSFSYEAVFIVNGVLLFVFAFSGYVRIKKHIINKTGSLLA